MPDDDGPRTRSKAVEQARGCVATKIGLSDMVDSKFGSFATRRKAMWDKLVKIRARKKAMMQIRPEDSAGL
jgi:hypothetical protein